MLIVAVPVEPWFRLAGALTLADPVAANTKIGNDEIAVVTSTKAIITFLIIAI